MRKYYLIILCVLFASCHKEEINESILGRWEWEQTNYTLRGTPPYTITPQSIDTSMVIDITLTHVEIYKNGIYSGKYTYTANTRSGDKNVISVEQQNTSSFLRVEHGPYTIENGSLYIAGGYNDVGGTQIFKRKNRL